MDKPKKKKLKIALLTSAILAVMFILFYYSKNKKAVSLKDGTKETKQTKQTNILDPEKLKKKVSKSTNPSTVKIESKSSDYKISSSTPSKVVKLKTAPSKVDKKNNLQLSPNKTPVNSISNNSTSKSEPKIVRPKVYSYTKRFLQIDQDFEKYKVLDGMYYVPNTSLNRSRYPAGIIQSDHILIKSKKRLNEASVLQNKDTGNYSLFKRVVKFKTQNEKGDLLLENLKNYKYKNLNELSMIDYKYELKFDRPLDALNAYSKYRSQEYVKWSSIDVVEFVKID